MFISLSKYTFIVLASLALLAAGCDSTTLLEPENSNGPITIEEPATTKPTSNCNANYSGCVPNASDVDCSGGSGNGPAYVSGPVNVTGSDVYDLDGDDDGIACE